MKYPQADSAVVIPDFGVGIAVEVGGEAGAVEDVGLGCVRVYSLVLDGNIPLKARRRARSPANHSLVVVRILAKFGLFIG